MLFVCAWGHPRFFGGVRVVHLFSFLWYVVLLRFACLRPVPCVLGVAGISGLFGSDCSFGSLYRLFVHLG